MIFHASIAADDPRHVAAVLAELWGGSIAPFPPVANGSWIAMAEDAINSAVEVYPRGTELVESAGDADAFGIHGGSHGTATHLAISSELGRDEVVAIADREGWPAKYRFRGSMFGVIEMWIEGHQMIEVLTPQMQAEYLATMTAANWRRAIAEAPSPPTT